MSQRNGIPLLPAELDPANLDNSPERQQINQGLDFGQDLCNGLVLSPQLFAAFLKYADPFYNATNDPSVYRVEEDVIAIPKSNVPRPFNNDHSTTSTNDDDTGELPSFPLKNTTVPIDSQEELLNQLNMLRSITEQRISDLDDQLKRKI